LVILCVWHFDNLESRKVFSIREEVEIFWVRG